MKNEEINISIAEVCGWVNILTPHEDQYHFLTDMQLREAMGRVVGRNVEIYSDGLHHPIPNYCNDLNAMHEAEETLDYEQLCNMQESIRFHHAVIPFHATAYQRAEAFIRTIGRWKEEK